MSIASNIAVTGIMAAQKNIATRAHNMANLHTPGFQPFSIQTTDLMYNVEKVGGIAESEETEPTPVGVMIGSGTKVSGIFRMLRQMQAKETGKPLDIMVEGNGYFKVKLPESKGGGSGYTLAGILSVSPESGLLVTAQGYPLEPAINVGTESKEQNNIKISADGKVTYTNPNNQNEIQEIGQIQLFKFPNEVGLHPMGDSIFVVTKASGEEIEGLPNSNGFGSIRQGAYAASAVQSIEELTGVLDAQREHEAGSKVIKAAEEAEQAINNIKS